MSLLLSKDLLWSFKWGSRAINAQHQKEVGYRNSTQVHNPALVQWSSVDAASGWVCPYLMMLSWYRLRWGVVEEQCGP